MEHCVKCGDTLNLINEIKKSSIDLLVTSPPYWAKRNYNNGEHELGSEPAPEEYVKTLADFFDKLKPLLKPTANVFINIGDTYFGSGAGAWSKYLDESGNETRELKERKEKFFTTKPLQPKIKQDGKLYQNKQLLLIPARFAIEMQSRGWILRDDIIWQKPNRIPASVTDRFNNTYEHVYHFVLSKTYFFDLDAVKVIGGGRKKKKSWRCVGNQYPAASIWKSHGFLPRKTHRKNRIVWLAGKRFCLRPVSRDWNDMGCL